MYSDKQTHFDDNTPERVKQILESELHSHNRIRLFYGDKETGRDWNEEYQTMGYISRSGGSKPIMILVNNVCSYGGGAILTDCIVKITKNGRTLYQHPNYSCAKHVVGNPVNDLNINELVVLPFSLKN